MIEQALGVIIAGPPKSGKSRLARAMVEDLTARGYAVTLTDEGRTTEHNTDTPTGDRVRIETLAAYGGEEVKPYRPGSRPPRDRLGRSH